MPDLDAKLKQLLWTAAEHAAPDPLERILAACEEPRKEEQKMEHTHTTEPNKTAKKRWMSLTAAAMLAVLVGLGAGVQSWRNGRAVASVVSLDVNPSIQLQVNRKERVLSAQPMNADAWEVLQGMELEGTQLNVAVNAIMGSLLQHGYLTEAGSAILISVEDRDAQRAGRLEAELNQTVSAAVEEAVVHSQVLAYDAGQEPEPEGVSSGKAALIRAIRELNGSLAFEELTALSVEELWQLRDAGAPGLPIGLSAAAEAAETYAGTLALDSFVWEADAELDETPAHYEVELYQPHNRDLKYEYRVDAYTGEVLTGPANILQPAAPAGDAGTPEAALLPTQEPAAAGAGTGSGTAGLIGEAQAKSAALRHAGLQESGVRYCNAWLEYDDGRMEHYEVEFGTDSARYEYEIGLYDGAVLKSEQKVFGTPSAPSSGEAAVGEERAREIAYAHAGVQAADAVLLKSKLDRENGVQVYELEFRSGNTKYEYEIAADGTVLKAERDAEVVETHHPESGGHHSHIGIEAAKAAALSHAGVAAGDAWDMKCELDCDDGRYLYEVEFRAGGVEYEYEIDAASGAVLKSEMDD